MSTLTLRGLAKAYSDSIVDRKKYIHERRQLIDDITNGQVEIVPYEAAPPPAPRDLERTFRDGETTHEPPLIETDAPQTPPHKSNLRIVIVAIISFAGIALFGWIQFAPQTDSPLPTAIEPPVNVMTIDNSAPSGDLLSRFLDENLWQPERIDRLIHERHALPDETKLALADSSTMHRATELIHQKFLEENALLELGDRGDVIETQRQLLDLAAELSPGNERIMHLEAEWHASNDAFLAQDRARSLPADDRLIPTTESAPAVVTSAATPTDNTALTTEVPDVIRHPSDDEIASADDGQSVVESVPDPSADADQIAAHEIVVEDPAIENSGKTSPGEPENLVVTPPTMGNAVTTPGTVALNLDTQATPKQPPVNKSSCHAALAKQRRPFCRDAIAEKVAGPGLVLLPAGRVEIGGRKPEEQPRRSVIIARLFTLSSDEISFGEFEKYCQATKTSCPAQPWSDPNLPVVNVSWSLAVKYTEWLSQVTGATYRLPSEAEWEYAARAGSTTPYPFGDEALPTDARFSFRGAKTMPMSRTDRSVNRNAFRLYHMVGNVREWVLDSWHENHAGAPSDASARNGNSDHRVVRGGSYSDGANKIRSASRQRLLTRTGDTETGFRVLREV